MSNLILIKPTAIKFANILKNVWSQLTGLICILYYSLMKREYDVE